MPHTERYILVKIHQHWTYDYRVTAISAAQNQKLLRKLLKRVPSHFAWSHHIYQNKWVKTFC